MALLSQFLNTLCKLCGKFTDRHWSTTCCDAQMNDRGPNQSKHYKCFFCHFYVRSTQNIGIFQNQPKEALVHVLVHVIMTLCTLVCQYDNKIQNQVT